MSYNGKTILAIIPARGGSKSIFKKNIYPINGKPLIQYTLDAAISSDIFDYVVVSSDDQDILSVAEKNGVRALLRSSQASSDQASSEMVVSEVLSNLAHEGKSYDLLMLLQPTSPLRDKEDIKNASSLLLEKNADCVISVFEPTHSPFKSFKFGKNGFLEGLIDNKTPFLRRQDLPSAFMPNGAIYIIYTDVFLQNKALFSEYTLPYLMPFEKSIDIDTLDDLTMLEEILKKFGK